MNDHLPFQRFAGAAAIAAFPMALASVAVPLVMAWFSFDAFFDPSIVLPIGERGARLIRAALILKMFGYYLLLMPLALVLWRRFEPRSPDWARFYTFCGLGYIFTGAAGAAVLAGVAPPLIGGYSWVSTAHQVMVETVLAIPLNMVYVGMWNVLEMFLAASWFIGIGLLMRGERRTFGLTSLILGFAAALDALAATVGVEALVLPGLLTYFLLAPLWALWLGLGLVREPALRAREQLGATV